MHAFGRGIQQCFQRAHSEPRTHPNYKSGNGQRGERVGIPQPRNSDARSKPYRSHSQHDGQRAPHVRGKMQRVRFQRFAFIFSRHAPKRTRTHQIHADRDAQQANRQQAWTEWDIQEEQAAESFVNNIDRGHQQ